MPKKLPVFLVESEFRSLIDSPAKMEEGKKTKREDYRDLNKRDYAMLITFGFTGVRLMEIVGLNLRDVDFERKNIRVMGKGSKERIIPLNQVVVTALKEWLALRPKSEDEAVFLNRFGRRMTTRGVRQMVEKYVKACGISKDHVSPHKLRHTFATLLHVNGVDIVEIQALLGHSAITSTEIYTHVSSTKLKSAVEKLEGIEEEPD